MWLEKEAVGKQLIKYIAVFLILNFAYSIIIFVIIRNLNIDISRVGPGTIPMFKLSFPVILLAYAFLEEIIFRLPLAIIVGFEGSLKLVIIAAIVLSAIFGYIHGGVPHIFLQGVGGFFYCLLFLKCGGLQGKWGKAILVTTITHFLFNIIIACIAIAHGVVTF